MLQERDEAAALRPRLRVRDISAPMPAEPIPARVHGPERAAGAPMVVYWHGGWAIAGPDTHDTSARALQAEPGAVVPSTRYRQAPEHKLPAAHETPRRRIVGRWRTRGRALGADPRRVAVAGESAGGSFVTNSTAAARDMRLPMPDHMALIYPVAGTDTNTPSYLENTAAVPLPRAVMPWFADKATRGQADLQATPGRGRRSRRAGLPPATIVSAETGPFRSGGETLAAEPREAGVPVERRNPVSVTHEFFGIAPVVADATAARRYRERAVACDARAGRRIAFR